MILLDTHILVWVVTGSTGRLGESLVGEIDKAVARGRSAVSAATFWELEVKRRKTRHDLPLLPPIKGLRSAVLAEGLREVPVSGSLWVEAVGLVDEAFHRDPADQLIVATAIRHGYQLLTRDRRILGWAERTGRVALFAHDSVP
ncbi:MAG: type II toxin-antitoxin system VapC family toxin [bacterium]|nr:type II toxin-antitoxin system VapC family toxin [bacterium]MDE0287125.1 type II toxin-antitoxin system VapC family toxin [bacterium]MDE0437557.1 type II toxin-antitoxin system VapC family toxin [bacterium]